MITSAIRLPVIVIAALFQCSEAYGYSSRNRIDDECNIGDLLGVQKTDGVCAFSQIGLNLPERSHFQAVRQLVAIM